MISLSLLSLENTFAQTITPAQIYHAPAPTPTYSPTPTLLPTATPTPTVFVPAPSPQQDQPTADPTWGIAQHVTGHEWTIRVGEDAQMASASDIFAALNQYRQTQGKGTLQWDNTLASYAQQRASLYSSQGKLDDHSGFNDFVQNQDGFHKLGYSHLGENAALIANPLLGVHIIEWLFAGDPEHNANQLDSSWSSVGIGVSGFGIDLVFGGGRL